MKTYLAIDSVVENGIEYAAYKIYPWEGTYVCEFFAWGHHDTGKRGTYGTGCKHYDTLEQAVKAGKRHLSKFRACMNRF